mmetsp:Transcript_72287/g.186432  ORF Transcript_72287/g.186432 Transcript_72287/m.186432 type:complete len:261 (-) Transcript_72287:2-784(-)
MYSCATCCFHSLIWFIFDLKSSYSRVLGSTSRNITSSAMTVPAAATSMHSKISATSAGSHGKLCRTRKLMKASWLALPFLLESSCSKNCAGLPKVSRTQSLKRSISAPSRGTSSSSVRLLKSPSPPKSRCASPVYASRSATWQKSGKSMERLPYWSNSRLQPRIRLPPPASIKIITSSSTSCCRCLCDGPLFDRAIFSARIFSRFALRTSAGIVAARFDEDDSFWDALPPIVCAMLLGPPIALGGHREPRPGQLQTTLVS